MSQAIRRDGSAQDQDREAREVDPTGVDVWLARSWRTLRRQPGLIGGTQVLRLVLLPNLLIALGLAFTLMDGVWLFVTAGLVVIGIGSLYLILWASNWRILLRGLRGERSRTRSILAGVADLPGMVVGTLLTGGSLVAVLLGLLFLAGLLLRITRMVLGMDPETGFLTRAVLPDGLASALVASLGYTVVSAIVSFVLLAGLLYVGLGLALWPLTLVDRDGGGFAAVRESWVLMRGNRLALLNLLLALFAIVFLTSFIPGVGLLLVIIGAILPLSLAAFYDGLERPIAEVEARTDVPDTDARARPWSRWAVDAFALTAITWATWLAVLVASIADLIALSRDRWIPYGPALMLLPMLLPPILMPAFYTLIARYQRRSFGAWVTGRSWGRAEWLALAFLIVYGLSVIGATARILWEPVQGVTARGVGHEMARNLVAELPGVVDSRPWSGDVQGDDLLDVTDGQTVIEADYVVTTTTGAGWSFNLVDYSRVETAEAAEARLQAAGIEMISTADVANPKSAAAAENAPSGAGMAIRDGSLILLGSGELGDQEELEELLSLQGQKLETARSAVRRVRPWLRKSPQALEDIVPQATADAGR